MPTPAFVAKGTAANVSGNISDGTWSLAPTLPGTIDAGNIIIIFVGGYSQAGSIDSFDTPSGYTLGAQSGIGNDQAAAYFYKVADGSEGSSNVTCSGTFFGDTYGRIIAQAYVFSNTDAGSFHAVGGTNTGTSTTPSFASVVTTLSNQLAVGLVWARLSTTIGSMTGETGGDWIEAAAEDTASTRVLQCQTATMNSAGTISGGSTTITSSVGWRTFSFALKEASTALPPKPLNIQTAAHRASRW